MARIRLGQVTSETAPPAGQVSIYSKIDDKLYYQISTGDEYELFSSGTPGIGGYELEQHEIDFTQFADKEIILSEVPTQPTRTIMMIDGAGPCFYGVDFTVSGNVLTWNGLRLDGLIGLDDLVQIIYF